MGGTYIPRKPHSGQYKERKRRAGAAALKWGCFQRSTSSMNGMISCVDLGGWVGELCIAPGWVGEWVGGTYEDGLGVEVSTVAPQRADTVL